MAVSVISVLAYLILGPLAGGLLAGVDRKITARMQGRKGPSVFQPFYDLYKLFNKQAVVVNNVQDFLVCGFLIFIVFTGCVFFSGGDLLLDFFALTLSEMFFIMSAFSASSPYSSMGAQRELMQMMAYEPMVLLVGIGFYLVTGSFSVSDIIQYSKVPAVVSMPGIFIGFLWVLVIKFRKSPIVGLFFVTSDWWSLLIAVAVCLISYFSEILTDNIFPRVKWEFMLKTTWAITLIAGIINLMILTLIK